VAAEFKKLGWYFFTVLLGLSIHGCIVLPAIFVLMTRTLPFRWKRKKKGKKKPLTCIKGLSPTWVMPL
jgi:hypothetical protein